MFKDERSQMEECGKGRAVRRSWLAVILSGLLLIGTTSPANATYYSGGVGTRQFSLQITGVNSTWKGYLQTGITSWNDTYGTTKVLIGTTASSSRIMTAGRYNTTWLGLYSPGGTRSARTFTIQANAAVIEDMTGGTFARWAKFTATHELGHALSLADNPSTSSSSIMKYRASTANPGHTPYKYDKDEVVRIY